MVVGNKELKVPVNRNLLKMRSGLLQRTENLQSPCGCVIDGQVIRTASSSFDPSAKTPVCRLPLSRLNWMWRIDLPRLLMLNSQLHRSCLYSGTVERKWETQRLILQTNFNGFVGYINDIDLEWSVSNEECAWAVMWCATTERGGALGGSAWMKHLALHRKKKQNTMRVLTWETFCLFPSTQMLRLKFKNTH